MARKVYPRRMTHNNFDLDMDIIKPIKDFLKKWTKNLIYIVLS